MSTQKRKPMAGTASASTTKCRCKREYQTISLSEQIRQWRVIGYGYNPASYEAPPKPMATRTLRTRFVAACKRIHRRIVEWNYKRTIAGDKHGR